VPSFDSGDNFVRIGCPCEGFGLVIMFGEEAVDGGLEINDGVKNTAFQAAFGEFGEELPHTVL